MAQKEVEKKHRKLAEMSSEEIENSLAFNLFDPIQYLMFKKMVERVDLMMWQIRKDGLESLTETNRDNYEEVNKVHQAHMEILRKWNFKYTSRKDVDNLH